MSRAGWKRIVLWSALVVVAVIAIGWYATHRGNANNGAAASASSGPSVTLAVARDGVFVDRVSAQGRIGPPAGSDTKLAFPSSGILDSVDVQVGDKVRAGQQLAALRRAGLSIAVQQANAQAAAAAASYGGGSVPSAALGSAQAKLAVAQAHLALLQRGGTAALSSRIAATAAARQAALQVSADQTTLARQQALYHGGVVAFKDVQVALHQLATDLAAERSADAAVAAAGAQYEAAFRQAQADVALGQSDVRAATAQGRVLGAQAQQAGAALAMAQRDLANGVLQAPSDGVVLSILKRPGESVDPTTPVMDLGPGSGNDVTLYVPADQARRIAVGDVASLNLTRRNEHSTGRVTAVVPAVDPTTQESTVIVSGVPADALPGDAVTASIAVAHIRGVLVPSSAIVQDPQTGKTVVFERMPGTKAGEFTSKQVVVGADDSQTAVIVSGLRAGAQIAAQGGYNLLAPGGA